MVVAERQIYEVPPKPRNGIKPRPQIKKRNRLKPLLLVGVMFIVFSALIANCVRIANANYELLQMKKELASLQKTNDDLRLQLTLSQNIDHIEQIARTKLNMHYPNPSQTVYINIAPENGYTQAVPGKEAEQVQKHKSIWALIYGLLD